MVIGTAFRMFLWRFLLHRGMQNGFTSGLSPELDARGECSDCEVFAKDPCATCLYWWHGKVQCQKLYG